MNITICDRCGKKANGEFSRYRITDDEKAVGLGGTAVDICKPCVTEFTSWWNAKTEKGDVGAWIDSINDAIKVGGTD